MKPCKESCSKCGSEDIYRRFYQKGAEAQSPLGKSDRVSSAYVDRAWAYKDVALKDCIVHTCRVCGYTWDGPPLKGKRVG